MSSSKCLNQATEIGPQNPSNGCVHSCDQCPYSTKSLFFMLNHLRHHKGPPLSFDCGKSVEKYTCKRCHFGTHLITVFNEHSRHHARRKSPKRFRPGGVPRHRCRCCPFQSASKLVLLKHTLGACPKTHAQMDACEGATVYYKCDQCPLQTRFKANLIRHKKSQHQAPERIKWYRCDQCDFQAKNRDNIKSHVISRHLDSEEIRWYQCKLCPYKGKKQSALTAHVMFQHTESDEIVWYRCAKCTFRSKKKFNLQVHLQSVHRLREQEKKKRT